MVKKIVLVAALLLSLFNFVPVESIPETFLIVYRKIVPHTIRDLAFTFVMKVNPAGEIVMKQQRIAPELDRSFDAIGISWGRPGFNLWTSGFNPNLSGSRFLTRRLTMRSSNFATTDIKPVHVEGASHSFLSITDKANENFILFAAKGGVAVIAARLSKEGSPTGEVWQLSRPKDRNPGRAIVSADGRIAAWISNEGMVIQRLHSNGRPSKIRSVTQRFRGATSLAITNVLPGHKRYLLLTSVHGNGSCSGYRNRYALLVIDDTTAKLLDTAFQFVSQTDCFDATAQIDPKGRFFIYTDFQYSRGPVRLGYPLLFQRLDVNGRRTGVVRPLADKVELGFSMLPN